MGINLYLIFALVSTSFLGLIKILSIIPFNRMAADDFSFTVSLLHSKNIFTFVYAWYQSLTARYTANILIGTFGVLSGPGANPYIFTLLTVFFGFFAFAFFLSSLIKTRIFDWKNILVSLFLLVVYFVITPSQRESWYWMTSAATYVWPAFINLVIVSLLIKGYKAWWTYVVLFVLTFLAGGTNECTLVTNVLFSGLTVLFLVIKKPFTQKPTILLREVVKNIKKPSTLLKQLLVILVAALLALIVIYLAPGNDVRMQSTTSSPMSLFGSLAYSFRDGPLLVWEIVKTNFVLLLSAFISLAYFFSKMTVVKKKIDQKSKEGLLNRILFTLSVPIGLSIIFTMLGYLSLGRVLEIRAFAVVAFFILFSFILASYFLSILVNSWGKNAQRIFMGFVVVSSLLIFITGLKIIAPLASDVYIAKNYSQAFDKTLETIRLMPLADEQYLYIDQLPPSGQVKFWQVTPSSEAWENHAVSRFLNINATIVAK